MHKPSIIKHKSSVVVKATSYQVLHKNTYKSSHCLLMCVWITNRDFRLSKKSNLSESWTKVHTVALYYSHRLDADVQIKLR